MLGTSYTNAGDNVKSTIIKGAICQRKTCPKYNSLANVVWIMALGINVLIILVVACSFGLGIVILPATPQTASAYNCFVVTQECLQARDPMDLMVKLFPDMLPKFS